MVVTRSGSHDTIPKARVLHAWLAVCSLWSGSISAQEEFRTSVYDPYSRTPDLLGTAEPWVKEGFLADFELPVVTRLSVQPFYDDNVYYTNLFRRASFGSFIRPQFLVPLTIRNNIKLDFDYSFKASLYENASNNNYVDNYVNAYADLRFSHRSRLQLKGGLSFAHDPLGTQFSQGLLGILLRSPNEWHSESLGGIYQYGAEGAKGRIDAFFNVLNRVYDNHPEITRQRDVNSFNFGTVFSYRIRPKTRLLFQIDDTISDYLHSQNNGRSLDNNQLRFLTGATWDATAKTTGTLKIGYIYKLYDDPAIENFGGLAFEGAVTWAPRSRDSLRLGISKTINESNDRGTGITVESYAASWRHQWLQRVSTHLSAHAQNSRYEGFDREDKRYGVDVGINYKLHRSVNLGLEYTYSERRSDLKQFEYNRNLVLLSLDVAF